MLCTIKTFLVLTLATGFTSVAAIDHIENVKSVPTGIATSTVRPAGNVKYSTLQANDTDAHPTIRHEGLIAAEIAGTAGTAVYKTVAAPATSYATRASGAAYTPVASYAPNTNGTVRAFAVPAAPLGTGSYNANLTYAGNNFTAASYDSPSIKAKTYTGDAAPALKGAALFGSFLAGVVVLTQML